MGLPALQRWMGALLETLPAEYRQRSCQGTQWKRAFPAASKGEIRGYLTMFVRAFAFADGHRLLFKPDDRLLDIYRRLYPQRWMPDALELETLAQDVKREHGISLESCWRDDLTLGELFARTRKSKEAIA